MESSTVVVVVVVSTTVGEGNVTAPDVVRGVSEDEVVDSGAELDVQAAAIRATATMMPNR